VQRFEILAEILGLSKDSVSIRSGFSDIAGFYNERHRNVYFLQNVAGERNMQFFSDKRLGFSSRISGSALTSRSSIFRHCSRTP